MKKKKSKYFDCWALKIFETEDMKIDIMLQCTQQFGHKDGYYSNFYKNEKGGNKVNGQ